jgi:hypothetical protein
MSSDYSTEEMSDEDYQLDCGLPVSFIQEDDHCRGCFATFSRFDEDRLGTAWQQCVTTLNALGYRAAIPTMDRHFERVFYLLVKDWTGRIQDVEFSYSDAEYTPSEVGDDSEYPSDEQSE